MCTPVRLDCRQKRSFRHTPPPTVKNRWPGDGDWQHFPVDQRGVAFMDVAVSIQASGFLDPTDVERLGMAHPDLVANSLVLDTWISKPWSPIRRRRWGFGKVSKDRGLSHDRVNPRSMIHFAWKFLTPAERRLAMEAFPQWKSYAALRRFACVHSVAELKEPRVLPADEDEPTALDKHRVWLNSAGLLRFDFNHGDLIRWMGGEYTNRHRDFNADWDVIESKLQNRSIPSDLPPTKLDLAYRIQTEGVPLRGQFTTPMTATGLRNSYDNHPAVDDNLDKVEKKFAKEEWRSYHLHYLRFVYEFIPGLVINPIQWVFDKGKGRICIDCSNGPDPLGSINRYIPSPKEVKAAMEHAKTATEDAQAAKAAENLELECPQVFYQYAFQRFLRRILQMRITRPNEPIMVHADDIEAAFRRVLYHPDMACAFAYVYSDYLMVPVGQVFGSRSAPSYYCVLADVRQALAACRPDDSIVHPLVASCTFETDSSTTLVQVPQDSHYPLLSQEEQESMYNASFVDDNGVVAYLKEMPQALQHSVQSAFETFGVEDRRGGCLQDAKWTSLVSETFMFLGFRIDTHHMTVSWPLEKRKALHTELLEILARRPKYVTPKEMAHIVGVIRSASEIAPWGTFLSFNLQNGLTSAARNAYSTGRTWWTRSWIYLSNIAIATIHQLLETLLVPESSPLWSRPIALYLERDPTHAVYSDASYAGIGGWSSDFGFLWRICRDDLVRAGFDMKPINIVSSEPSDIAHEGLHINPLEFLGALLNLWITIKLVMKAGPRAGGYVIDLLADNTTALSWMSLASRTKNPLLQGLARIGAALLVRAAELLTKVSPKHFPGDQNVVADALSRPPTRASPNQNVLDCVIAQWSQLDKCRICLLPFKLLSEIASVISSRATAVQYEVLTTNLLTLELDILDLGVRTWDSPSTIYED